MKILKNYLLPIHRRYFSLNQKLLTKNINTFSNQKISLNQQIHKNHRSIKQQQLYGARVSELIYSPIQLNYLVPTNIFTEQVKIQEYPKIIIEDKTSNHFQNSYVSINLDISQNKELQNTLRRYTQKHIRIGRLLQVMDMIAGLVSYRHCFGSFKKNNPFTLVTGSVQSIELFEQINCEENIKVEGFLNHTGKTSMEIQINIYQSKRLKLNSYFIMICRNSLDLSKGYEIPKLNLSLLSQQEQTKAKKRQILASEHINTRKSQIQQSFDKRPPNIQEIKQIHELFLQRKNDKTLKNYLNSVKISQTHVQTNEIMHLQDRNVHGKIFGGFLMRQMLQIGWFCAKKFLVGNQFQIQGITDIYFLTAVQIGDGLTISASITYTNNDIIIATVQAHSINFKTGHKKACCTSQLILKVVSGSQIKNVYPDSYAEALKYLNSKRTYLKMFG